MTEPGRRDRKKAQTRATLIAAALRLVADRGIDHVTVDDIAAAADVSARTFFNYFPSKDEALLGDHVTEVSQLVGQLRALPAGLPVLEVLRRSLAPAVAAMQADRDLWFLRMRVIMENPGLLPRLIARSAEADAVLTAAVADRAGVPADHGWPELAVAVTGAALRTAMTRWAKTCGDRDLADLLDEAFTALAAGLADPVPTLQEGPR